MVRLELLFLSISRCGLQSGIMDEQDAPSIRRPGRVVAVPVVGERLYERFAGDGIDIGDWPRITSVRRMRVDNCSDASLLRGSARLEPSRGREGSERSRRQGGPPAMAGAELRDPNRPMTRRHLFRPAEHGNSKGQSGIVLRYDAGCAQVVPLRNRLGERPGKRLRASHHASRAVFDAPFARSPSGNSPASTARAASTCSRAAQCMVPTVDVQWVSVTVLPRGLREPLSVR